MGVRGRITQQRLKQNRNQIGHLGQAVWDRTAVSHVGQQRERQRVAPTQPQQPPPV